MDVKETALRREVAIEAKNIDKVGNSIGNLFVENTNLSLHLVLDGSASMHFTVDRKEIFESVVDTMRGGNCNQAYQRRSVRNPYTLETDMALSRNRYGTV